MTTLIVEELKSKKISDNASVHREADTNEPVFNESTAGSWERSRPTFTWHPSFVESHPSLKNSLKYGNNQIIKKYDSKAKDRRYEAERHYNEAARNDFKDKIPHTFGDITKKVDPADNSETHHRDIHFNDPTTGEKIISVGTSSSDGKNFRIGYSEKSKVNQEYLKTHDIDAASANMNSIESSSLAAHHDAADKIFKTKGKSYFALGKSHDEKAKHTQYRISESPEDASVIHEKIIRKQNPKHTLIRTSPTSFHAMPTGSYGNAHQSFTVPGTLHHIVNSYDIKASPNKLDHPEE